MYFKSFSPTEKCHSTFVRIFEWFAWQSFILQLCCFIFFYQSYFLYISVGCMFLPPLCDNRRRSTSFLCEKISKNIIKLWDSEKCLVLSEIVIYIYINRNLNVKLVYEMLWAPWNAFIFIFIIIDKLSNRAALISKLIKNIFISIIFCFFLKFHGLNMLCMSLLLLSSM